MLSILRYLDIGAVVIISITLLLFLTIIKTSNGTLQHPDKMPNKTRAKSTTHTGQEGREVDLRLPEALLFTLQAGDLAREIPATELRVPHPLLSHLQVEERGCAIPIGDIRRFPKCPAVRQYDEQGRSHLSPSTGRQRDG
jgi:hypothetical protein